MSCGADNTANTLLTSLVGNKDFDLPDVNLDGSQFQIPDQTSDLYKDVDKLKNEDLTTRVVDGDGVFDALMSGLSAHMKKEYEQNRLSGDQYTKAYISAVGGALQTATSFLLGRDQAYWQAVLSQQQARRAEIETVTARVQLETAKAQLAIAHTQKLTAEAEYSLTKLKLATEDQQYCLLKNQTEQGEYTLNDIMPLQKAQLTSQNTGISLDNDAKTFNNEEILPLQKTQLDFQNTGLGFDNDTKEYTYDNLLPLQEKLLSEQVEVQRAQTSDTRQDGTNIRGSVGKQKDLYDQQITSYQRDAEVKAAKLFTDAWITMKTIDDLYPVPQSYDIPSLDGILGSLKTNNGIG